MYTRFGLSLNFRVKPCAALLAASAVALSCSFDSDARCGPGQEYSEEFDLCLCASGYAISEDGCEKCGRNEEPGPVGCQCKEGYELVDDECEAEDDSDDDPTGDDADDDDSDDDDSLPMDAGGPATSLEGGLEGGVDEPDSVVDASMDPDSDDSMEIDGLGMACTMPEDCEGTDAPYCDTLVTQACLVTGCEIGGSDCPPGYGCQDLSMLGATEPVCAAAVCDEVPCPEGFECCPPLFPGFPSVCLSGGCP